MRTGYLLGFMCIWGAMQGLVLAQTQPVTADTPDAFLLASMTQRVCGTAMSDSQIKREMDRLHGLVISMSRAQVRASLPAMVEGSRSCGPHQRYVVLRDFRRGLAGTPMFDELRDILLSELTAIVLQDRRDLTSPSEEVDQRLATYDGKCPWKDILLSHFAAVALAVLDSEPDDDQRYASYVSICRIATLVSTKGVLYSILFGDEQHKLPNGVLFDSRLVRPFSKVQISEGGSPTDVTADGIRARASEVRLEALTRALSDRVDGVEVRLGKLSERTAALEAWRGEITAWQAWVKQNIDRLDADIERLVEAKPGYPITRAGATNDFDGDGVPDEVEQNLLDRFAPVFATDDPDDRLPPLPIRWYLKHCDLRWYTRSAPPRHGVEGDYNGKSAGGDWHWDPKDTTANSGEFLSPEFFKGAFLDRYFPNGIPSEYCFRLRFKEETYRDGKDPVDPRTWAIAEKRQDCLYGRCSASGVAGQYILQYYLFFGWNDVDASRNEIGCPYGNHEGDLVCVEFTVRQAEGGVASVVSAVYHNHGRQVFITDPLHDLDWSGDRAVVYLEREEHEALPWKGSCGFHKPGRAGEADIRPSVYTNHILRGEEKGWGPLTELVGDECEGVRAVREHWGKRSITFTHAINLGERHRPNPAEPEAFYVMTFAGRYGDNADDGCDDPITHWHTGKPVDSPKGPAFQPKMWDDEYDRSRDDIK